MFLIRNLYIPAKLWYYFEKWSFFIDTHVRVREIYKNHIYILVQHQNKFRKRIEKRSFIEGELEFYLSMTFKYKYSTVTLYFLRSKTQIFLSLYSANKANLANSSYLYTWKTLLMKMVFFLNPSCIDVLVNFKFKFLMLNDIIHTHSKIK